MVDQTKFPGTMIDCPQVGDGLESLLSGGHAWPSWRLGYVFTPFATLAVSCVRDGLPGLRRNCFYKVTYRAPRLGSLPCPAGEPRKPPSGHVVSTVVKVPGPG